MSWAFNIPFAIEKAGPKSPDWVFGDAVDNNTYAAVELYDKLSLDVGFEIDIDWDARTTSGGWARFMNAWNPDTTTGFGYGIIPGNASYIFGDINQKNMTSYASDSVGRHKFSFNLNNSRKLEIDGVVKVSEMAAGSVSAPTDNPFLLLFANYNGRFWQGNNGYCYSGKVYYVKVTDGDSLVRDCVPAIDSDGNGALYDRVSGTFMTNRGTNPLTYGWD